MFERAFAMFAPFARRERPGGRAKAGQTAEPSTPRAAEGGEIDDLKRQMEEMQKRLDRLGDKDESAWAAKNSPPGGTKQIDGLLPSVATAGTSHGRSVDASPTSAPCR